MASSRTSGAMRRDPERVLRIAVVVPARDAARFLPECLASVRAQRRAADEVVIVDDGGDDDVARVCREELPTARVVTSGGVGAAAARNVGLGLVTADAVVFLDADDRLRPDALARFSAALERAPDVCLAYGEAVPMRADGTVYGHDGRPRFAQRPSGDAARALLEANFIATTGAACVRRAALVEVGGFRADLRRAHDWELWCRVARVGRFAYLGPPAVVERRHHDDSITSALGLSVDAHRDAIDAVFGAAEHDRRFSPAELARLRRRQLASAHALAGTECLKRRRFADARRELFAALRRRPLRVREAVLLAAATAGWLPAPLEARLR